MYGASSPACAQGHLHAASYRHLLACDILTGRPPQPVWRRVMCKKVMVTVLWRACSRESRKHGEEVRDGGCGQQDALCAHVQPHAHLVGHWDCHRRGCAHALWLQPRSAMSYHREDHTLDLLLSTTSLEGSPFALVQLLVHVDVALDLHLVDR